MKPGRAILLIGLVVQGVMSFAGAAAQDDSGLFYLSDSSGTPDSYVMIFSTYDELMACWVVKSFDPYVVDRGAVPSLEAGGAATYSIPADTTPGQVWYFVCNDPETLPSYDDPNNIRVLENHAFTIAQPLIPPLSLADAWVTSGQAAADGCAVDSRSVFLTTENRIFFVVKVNNVQAQDYFTASWHTNGDQIVWRDGWQASQYASQLCAAFSINAQTVPFQAGRWFVQLTGPDGLSVRRDFQIQVPTVTPTPTRRLPTVIPTVFVPQILVLNPPTSTPPPTATLTLTVPPTATPERLPDLRLVTAVATVMGDQIEITVEMVNDGDVASSMVTVSAVREGGGEAVITATGLEAGQSGRVRLTMDNPVEKQAADQQIAVTIAQRNGGREKSNGNNGTRLTIRYIPLPDTFWEQIQKALDELPIEIKITIGLGTLGAVATYGFKRTVKISRRRRWERRAKTQEPEQTCRRGQFYCKKVKLSTGLERYKITEVAMMAYDSGSQRAVGKRKARSTVVAGLNEGLKAYRRGIGNAALERLMLPASTRLMGDLAEWVRTENNSRDVRLSAHLEGSNVTFKFTLYMCGPGGWEIEDEWEKKVKDSLDDPLAEVRGVQYVIQNMNGQAAHDLSKRMADFIQAI